MARPLRLLIENGHYHVTARTWDRSPLYRADNDRRAFLSLLEATIERFDWRCLAYCLMDNHFHLLVRTPLANLPRGMQRVNSGYAQEFNRRYARRGPLFEGRYNAVLIQRDAHLLEVLRYIALNPVRAGVCRDPAEFRWSSYAATAGLTPASSYLAAAEVRELFAATTGSEGASSYRRFVGQAPCGQAPEGPVHGEPEFVRAAMQEVVREPELARRDWSAARPPLSSVLGVSTSGELMSKAYRIHGYTMASIAAHVGCHVSTASRRIRAHERALRDCKI